MYGFHAPLSLIVGDHIDIKFVTLFTSPFLATDPEVWIRFPALPDILRSSGSGTGYTQPLEYN
jgi:hypothetical protein